MTQTIMDDMKEHAQTSQDWAEVYNICNLLNKIKIDGQLDVLEKNCENYTPKIKQASKQELETVKNIIADIDWGEGPKLELIKYNIRSMNSGESVFLVPGRAQGLDAQQLLTLLKKVCDSDYPGDFVLGTVCVYFDKIPIEPRVSRSCHANALFGHLDVNYGVAKGSTLKLEAGWCRDKPHLPPYKWLQ